jgi:hypothetical protein
MAFDTPLQQEMARRSTPAKDSPNPSDKIPTGVATDVELLEMWEVMKHESFDARWVFERQWQRNIWYVLGRQWIEYQSKFGGWRDKRMAAWIPRPVTNKCKECIQTIRAMFTSVALSVNVRPNGSDPANVQAAAAADEIAPLLHEAHDMNRVMAEFDFWLLVTGNAFIHSFVDYDVKYGVIKVALLQCAACGEQVSEEKLAGAQPVCPSCQASGPQNFQPAIDEKTGQPAMDLKPKGKPITLALSPLEVAFSRAYTYFEDLPYVIRCRWRTKKYFQNNPAFKTVLDTLVFQKAPQDHSMALFTALTQTNDLGITPIYWSEGSGRGGQNDEGLMEYEAWIKPTAQYPDGLVFRVLGDGQNPLIAHLEETENIPGPLPYMDADNNPLFTFAHGQFEHVGGRILGSGPLDVIIQKQDQLNQLDSQTLLCLNRTANPVWIKPKGAGIQKLSGMPGLVIEWDPLTVSGTNAVPHREPGIPIDASIMALREQYLKDIEELSGTFDIMKGQKPTGVEAFSAIQALIERSQARFAFPFRSRGDVYKHWFKFAIELEREFGPDERIKQTFTPARTWLFKTFQRTQLQGSYSIVVEDGATTPKTNLGMRAAVEHANTLGMLNMQDPDQRYEALKLFGLTRMVPTLDINIQSALQKQQGFEMWSQNKAALKAYALAMQQQTQQFMAATNAAKAQHETEMTAAASSDTAPMPTAQLPPPPDPLEMTPLAWMPWYDAQIHMQEFIKWANGDMVRQLLQTSPFVKQLLALHQQAIAAAMPKPQAEPDVPKISFAFNGADLANPKVEALLDSVEPAIADAPNKPVQPKPSTSPGGPGGKPGGAGKAMGSSNANSKSDGGQKGAA